VSPVAGHKITLFTRDGAFIEQAWIPPFDPPPQVIRWGERTFTYRGSDHNGDADTLIYYECMQYPLTDSNIIRG